MKSSPLTALACTVAFLTGLGVAGPIGNVVAPTRTRTRMTSDDKFAKSGMEFNDWANKMVADGKMRWPDGFQDGYVGSHPNHTVGGLVTRQAGSWTLTNVVCGYVEGRETEYQEARDQFCEFAPIASKAGIEVMYELFLYAVCEEEENVADCIVAASAVAQNTQLLADIVYFGICAPLFDQLNTYCAGYTGGAAQINIVNSNGGTDTGVIEMQFYEDNYATCPAPAAATTCTVSHF